MRRSWRALAATALAAGLASAAAGPARAAGSEPAAARPSAPGYSVAGALNGVAAAAANNAWAVGEAAGRILLVHWNGRTWS